MLNVSTPGNFTMHASASQGSLLHPSIESEQDGNCSAVEVDVPSVLHVLNWTAPVSGSGEVVITLTGTARNGAVRCGVV